jgi:hypothetical protein
MHSLQMAIFKLVFMPREKNICLTPVADVAYEGEKFLCTKQGFTKLPSGSYIGMYVHTWKPVFRLF